MPPTSQKTWVVLIDVLGFSKRISDPVKGKALTAAYTDIVDRVRQLRTVKSAREIRTGSIPPAEGDTWDLSEKELARKVKEEWESSFRIFSDSIFMFFGEDRLGPAAPFRMPDATLEVSQALWTLRIPHRGAIAFGECHIDSRRNIFVGSGIVRAHEWERSQKWLGISVAPDSVEAFRPMMQNHIGAQDKYVEEDIPVPTTDGEVITWVLNPFKEADEQVLDGFLACHAEAQQDGNASVLAKYTRTANFIRDRVGHISDLDRRLGRITGRRN